jgi:hypothetical protein
MHGRRAITDNGDGIVTREGRANQVTDSNGYRGVMLPSVITAVDSVIVYPV